jgi:two-component system, OmpR family, response regulator ChvI
MGISKEPPARTTEDLEAPIIPDGEISFQYSENYCVCFVDLVDSTRLASRIRQSGRVQEFYSTYINSLSAIAKSYSSVNVKNTGDCLINYFPATSDSSDADAFRRVLECGFAILSERPELNKKLASMNLPALSYRISCDYGRVEVGKISGTQTNDLFGSTMNICAKINCMAQPNTMVVGGDLYQILKGLSISEYSYHDNGAYSLGLPKAYPVYAVTQKHAIQRPRLADLDDTPANAVSQENSGISNQNQATARESSKRPKIMIVDDEPDVLLTFKTFLLAENFDVETFDSPQPALKRFAECVHGSNYFDLAIIDIRMPGINGLQLHQRLKHINRSIKTIFVSGLDVGRELVTVLPEPGNVDIMKKPVNRETFSRYVKSVLSNS